MIKTVEVTNYLDESIEFELANPEKSGFYIQNIDGLGPPKANINTTEMATNDGAIFNSARATSRNIVITLGFLFQPDIETIRQLSYKYFPIMEQVKLKITTSNRIGEVYGRVESNEPVIFSQQQTTQISIICPNPFIYAEEINITSFSGVIPMFEFPFSNESLTDDLLIMGDMYSNTSRTVKYEGDAKVGVVIYISAFGPVSDLTIYNPQTNKQMTINSERMVSLTGSGIIEGDQIIISTVRGDKSITLIRGGISYNILNTLNRDAFWFQLVKGDNIFSYFSEYGLSNLHFRIENRVVYEGI